MTRGIERTFPRPFSETFRISKNEDFNGPYLENENEFLKNSFETVFRASKSCDRDQLVSAFQLTFNDFSSFNIGLSYKILFVHCNIFHCVLYSTFSPVNIKFFMFVFERCVKDV